MSMEIPYKTYLNEDEMPKAWYNLRADMPNKPMPLKNPKTGEAMKAEDLFPIFAQECSRQELDQTHKWIDIPEKVREMYTYYRSTPLVRAYGLEEALGTPAHIYFKNESVSPVGSHKLNSAIYQILGANGIIRVDYIIGEGDKIQMLEINTTPGMTATSFIPQQVRAAGIEMKDVLTEIIENQFD